MEVIVNEGYTETSLINNNKTTTNKSKWTGTYNGEEGNIDIETDTNGDRKGIHIEFTNDDINKLSDLLLMPSSNKSLDEQLRDDFLNQPFESNQETQLGEEMAKQIMNEEMQKSFPMAMTKYDVELMTPLKQNKNRYAITMKRKRVAKGNTKTRTIYKYDKYNKHKKNNKNNSKKKNMTKMRIQTKRNKNK